MGLRIGCLVVVASLVCPLATTHADLLPRPFRLLVVNQQLCGKVINHTANHGRDRRFYSKALCQKRDMYVYLPPGYDPCKQYPLGIVLHGFLADEVFFLDTIAKPLDKAIVEGRLPPMVIAAPDGSPRGVVSFLSTGTFFINSNLGNFEDYLVQDVYDFLMQHYSIRPEPEAHAILGASMGGAAAFANVMKHRDKFGVAAIFAGPLNNRWISCRGKYFDNFDPCCAAFRTDYSNGNVVIGRFYCSLVTVRLSRFIYPLYGKGNPCTAELIARENPIELLDILDIKPGHADFYVAYGGKDQFNIDAQVESFLHRAREKCIEVDVDFHPNGTHSVRTALKALPAMIDWLRPRLEPYAPH
jgi:hypothetical protein